MLLYLQLCGDSTHDSGVTAGPPMKMDGVSETLQRNLMSLQEQDVEGVASTAV